ncbi:hypothetical protein DMA11_04630 [Marinilabiliaceae bacterium JC017]|nr:hypothetical protein DMA11_04630 [Marinilabiliaceae bacterium JC017]
MWQYKKSETKYFCRAGVKAGFFVAFWGVTVDKRDRKVLCKGHLNYLLFPERSFKTGPEYGPWLLFSVK